MKFSVGPKVYTVIYEIEKRIPGPGFGGPKRILYDCEDQDGNPLIVSKDDYDLRIEKGEYVAVQETSDENESGDRNEPAA